jgi:hypothetical protein
VEGGPSRGLGTFVEVGQALLEIRDSRLYRESHGTFEVYFRERWAMGRNYANKIIAAAEVVAVLGTDVPSREAQARELAPLLGDEAAVVEAWREAKAEAEKIGAPLTRYVG